MIDVHLIVEQTDLKAQLGFVGQMTSCLLPELRFIIEKSLLLVELLVVQKEIKGQAAAQFSFLIAI